MELRLTSHQEFFMRDDSGYFGCKKESIGSPFSPVLYHGTGRNAIEGGINFDGGESRTIVGNPVHFACAMRIESSLPALCCPTGRTDS